MTLQRLLLQVIILVAVVNPASAAVRFFYPSAPLSLPLEKEMHSLLSEYNQLHPQSPVEWVKKGEEFSALRELMTASLAQALPDIAAIEWSETAPLAHSKIVPFQKSAPALIVDQEMVFRAFADPLKLPKTWDELLALTEKVGGLALPLQGPRGLWLFEALTGLSPPTMTTLLALPSHSPIQTRLSREQAVQAFIERRTPLLVDSTDLLPQIAAQAQFRWTAVPLPILAGGTSRMASGSRLVVLKKSPAAEEFLSYLFSPRVAARWATAGGFIPLKPEWVKTPEWKLARSTRGPYVDVLVGFTADGARPANADSVRARSESIQTLHELLTLPDGQAPPDALLKKLTPKR